VILLDHVVFILTGAVVDVRAEFVGEGPGIAGMAVGGDLLGSTWVTDLAKRRNALAAAISRVLLR
jgi:hypothetical protein